MAALHLPTPTPAHLHQPVARVRAVADDKVIGQAIVHPAPPVIVVKAPCAPFARGTVVGNDVFPFRPRHTWPCQVAKRQVAIGRLQVQLLSHHDQVAGQAVPQAELGDGNAVAACDRGECVAAPHRMLARPSLGRKPKAQARGHCRALQKSAPVWWGNHPCDSCKVIGRPSRENPGGGLFRICPQTGPLPAWCE